MKNIKLSLSGLTKHNPIYDWNQCLENTNYICNLYGYIFLQI